MSALAISFNPIGPSVQESNMASTISSISSHDSVDAQDADIRDFPLHSESFETPDLPFPQTEYVFDSHSFFIIVLLLNIEFPLF